MKTKITLLSLFIFAAFLSGNAQAYQVPNGNFTNWTGNVPNGWYTIDELIYAELMETTTFVTEDTNSANVAIAGTESAKLESGNIAGVGNLAGILSLGASMTLGGPTGIITTGAAYAYRPDSISFRFKYETVVADTALFYYSLTKWNSTNQTSTVIGGVPFGYNYILLQTDSLFETFEVSPNYTSDSIPDTLNILFYSGANHTSPGNTLWVDDVEMVFNSIPTDVNTLSLKTVVEMYPVPARASLNVSVADVMVGNSYSIFDMNGRVIANGIIESLKNTYDVSQYAGGSYIFAIYDNNHQQVNQAKFVVAK